MLPETLAIVGLYVAIHLIWSTLLSIHVVKTRAREKIDMLTGDNIAMLKAVRIHGNNSEYVPFALIGLLCLALLGTGGQWLHGLGIALTVGRIMHCQGLLRSTGATVGRVVGTILTWLVCLLIAVLLVIHFI